MPIPKIYKNCVKSYNSFCNKWSGDNNHTRTVILGAAVYHFIRFTVGSTEKETKTVPVLFGFVEQKVKQHNLKLCSKGWKEICPHCSQIK